MGPQIGWQVRMIMYENGFDHSARHRGVRCSCCNNGWDVTSGSKSRRCHDAAVSWIH